MPPASLGWYCIIVLKITRKLKLCRDNLLSLPNKMGTIWGWKFENKLTSQSQNYRICSKSCIAPNLKTEHRVLSLSPWTCRLSHPCMIFQAEHFTLEYCFYPYENAQELTASFPLYWSVEYESFHPDLKRNFKVWKRQIFFFVILLDWKWIPRFCLFWWISSLHFRDFDGSRKLVTLIGINDTFVKMKIGATQTSTRHLSIA